MSDSGDTILRIEPKEEYVPPPFLTRLAGAVAEYCADSERVQRDPGDAGHDLRQLRHQIDLLEVAFARQAAGFAVTDQYERAGSLSAEDWIRFECRMSGAAAHSAVCTGEKLELLPDSTAALRDGRIGFAHLTMLASTAQAVTERANAPRFDERPLLEHAMDHSVSRFRHDCARARHAADAAGFLSDHLTAVEWRAFEMVPCDGGVVLRGRLDTVGAATVRTALEPLAKRAGADDDRRRKRRMADALIELAHHGLDSGVLPSQAGQRPHLQVTATVETLLNVPGAPAGEMQFSTPVPAATVQRFACDSGITRVLFDTESAVIDVGRKRRIPSPAMRRAVGARDQGCVWPGCDRPLAWTAAHHVAHWTRDLGPTTVSNLGSVCHRHHEMIHEGSWRLELSDDGRWLALPPLPSAPRPSAAGPPSAALEELGRADVVYWDRLHPPD
jgi:hypothetical protein